MKKGLEVVRDSLYIYKSDQTIMVVDSNFGSLVQLKELFLEIAFPTDAVFFKDSVIRSLLFLKH